MSGFINNGESKVPYQRFDVVGTSNQDRANNWQIDENISIYTVSDGHGDKGDKYAEETISIIDSMVETIDWNEDDLSESINSLYLAIENHCKETLSEFKGGSTMSLCVNRKDRDFWVSNIGDSEVVLFDKNNNTHQVLSEDHSPLNIKEYERIVKEIPDVKFTYDRVRRNSYYPKFDVFSIKDDKVVANPVPENVYYKNVRSEYATLIGNRFKLAITRSFGDFLCKEESGVSAIPFISKYPPIGENQFVINASDGFWDCWKYEEIFENFVENVETWKSVHKRHAQSLFGRSIDDTTCYFIY